MARMIVLNAGESTWKDSVCGVGGLCGWPKSILKTTSSMYPKNVLDKQAPDLKQPILSQFKSSFF